MTSSLHTSGLNLCSTNFPEVPQCVLSSQKEIEEVMSLYFKPFYPEIFVTTQPNHAWLPYTVQWK